MKVNRNCVINGQPATAWLFLYLPQSYPFVFVELHHLGIWRVLNGSCFNWICCKAHLSFFFLTNCKTWVDLQRLQRDCSGWVIFLLSHKSGNLFVGKFVLSKPDPGQCWLGLQCKFWLIFRSLLVIRQTKTESRDFPSFGPIPQNNPISNFLLLARSWSALLRGLGPCIINSFMCSM